LLLGVAVEVVRLLELLEIILGEVTQEVRMEAQEPRAVGKLVVERHNLHMEVLEHLERLVLLHVVVMPKLL
jgi:hypothetical protein